MEIVTQNEWQWQWLQCDLVLQTTHLTGVTVTLHIFLYCSSVIHQQNHMATNCWLNTVVRFWCQTNPCAVYRRQWSQVSNHKMCMEYFQVLIAENFISPLCIAALICGTISDQARNMTFFISILEINSSWWNAFNNIEMQYNERLHKTVLCIFLIISVTCPATIHTKVGGGQSGNGTGFSQSTLVVPYQYHSPIAPCSFIYFLPTPYYLSNWKSYLIVH